MNILFCTAGTSYYSCGYDFEGWVERNGEDFKGEPKMGGCFDTLQNVTEEAGTWCFCDDWDGCIQALDYEYEDTFEEPTSTSNNVGGPNEGGKNLKCWKCVTNMMVLGFDLCSDNFSNLTQLTQCDTSSAFCVKQEAKGIKKIVFLYVCLCENICTVAMYYRSSTYYFIL